MTETTQNTKVIYRFGRFEVDAKERLLRRDGEIIPLTAKIFETLLLLVENNGRMLAKDEILESVWKNFFVAETNLTSNISRLRKILHAGGEKYIETFPKRGYLFRAEMERSADGTGNVGAESSSPTRPFQPLAVLPFQTASGDAALEALADNLSENLLNRLSQARALKVIARSSSFRLKSSEIDLPEAGRKLAAGSLLTGSIERRGEHLSLRVELVDARDGSRLWGEQYSIGAADTQTVEGRIAGKTAEKLGLKLTETEGWRLTAADTDNSQAYQLYLNGESLRRKTHRPESMRKAVEYYNQAIALDPNFALASVALASAYRSLLGFSGFGDNKAELKEKMYRAIERAGALDDSLYELHFTLAGIRMNELDWKCAEREYRRALELNPNSAAAHQSYAVFLSNFERHDEALTHARLALELDPLSTNVKIYLGRTLACARRYREAIESLKKITESEPDNELAHYYLGLPYVFQGMPAEALAEYEAANQIGTAAPNPFYAFALARAGKTNSARKIIEDIKNKNDYSPAEFAVAFIGVGETDEAFALLETAFAERDLQLQYLRVDPHYDALRSDSRFQDLMRRVGLI